MDHFFGLLPFFLIFGWGSWFMIRSTRNQAANRAMGERNTAAILENTAAVRELIARLDQDRR